MKDFLDELDQELDGKTTNSDDNKIEKKEEVKIDNSEKKEIKKETSVKKEVKRE
jgi:hypothetical protein